MLSREEARDMAAQEVEWHNFVPQMESPEGASLAALEKMGAVERVTFTINQVTITPDPALPGIGGAPTRATTLPTDAAGRKQHPVASGVLDYFPDAIVALSYLSWKGNDQHNPGKPLHWDRSKSGDEADTLMRHFLQRGTLDTDGVRHSAKFVWRALALLQKELEQESK